MARTDTLATLKIQQEIGRMSDIPFASAVCSLSVNPAPDETLNPHGCLVPRLSSSLIKESVVRCSVQAFRDICICHPFLWHLPGEGNQAFSWNILDSILSQKMDPQMPALKSFSRNWMIGEYCANDEDISSAYRLVPER
ncbi:hypothetical protein VTN77DRAFT_2805 [Rasamsonia byssochlamydoides]|uniref:uncharacterized protein n=1 Tax=Rasamsonia byssochlamydoides TaxID=89139 RepID=UPI00374399B5